MNRALAMLLIGLFFGGGFGFVAAASQGITLDGHDHAAAGHTGGGQLHAVAHDHGETLSLANDTDAPTLFVSVAPDPVAGWNLHIETTGFRFAPESASQAHVAGEGHAHIYVNGTKIARQYGPWLHIASLPAGTNEIEVTLNANDHRLLAVEEAPLRAVTHVVVD